MYKSLKRQRGMGWFGMLLLFLTIAFFAIVAVKVGPLYMNEGTIMRVVRGVANDPAMGGGEPQAIRRALEARWDIDYISQIDDKDVLIKRTDKGRVLAYDYEAKVNLFYNVFVMVHFKGDYVMKGSANSSN